ncbi:hypothetical protein DDB_G0281597 [Dictyostelium discoideum AX4]|uniref:Uncharacterized protein DDB_G0281597 n=1 Tax=Dictyostelium discoideum TaxID=44689 RepID=Y4551_DICDI|nr:hypothetical protein DDB_G0281597 [Dictyostelium discoideum AX4]Q54TR6.1 RecName: Full=Uncharacterized protein DDB_G0281597 [Dictyostelium discoideum]EAL66560.1 hypothetical protein DDB_G0281597 [Dictyostelium discoideum AX4]|eukprot:XP_640525.1 hypothetical protein DDB_G0281597 [Dictyostelium discoideum AX4]
MLNIQPTQSIVNNQPKSDQKKQKPADLLKEFYDKTGNRN